MTELQSVLMPNPSICSEESLYCHREGNRVLFDGYFNLFYIEKRKRYTDLMQVELVLNLQGYSSICLMHNKSVLNEQNLTAEERRQYTFRIPYEETQEGVFWFSLTEARDMTSEMRFISGGYRGESSRERLVNIAVDICTFHRESYVTRNMRKLLEFLQQDDGPEVADHLHVYIVDNGNTLKNHAGMQTVLTANNFIDIIPNRNLGGAGGFTRGMLAALDEKKERNLTHILLMDDDAVFDPDMFIRLYGILSMLKEEYKDITVGGALWREDYPYIQQACGEYFEDFLVKNSHPLYDLRTYENCTSDFMCKGEEEHPLYNGWWCCCYYLEVVGSRNLPLPMFLHHDDISYGLRNEDEGILFMNGIGVWHKGFDLAYPGTNRYYDVRNPLITTALYCPDMKPSKILKQILVTLTALLMEYRYAEAMMAGWGVEDFCKGPKWLYEMDAEKLHRELRSFWKEEFPLKDYRDLSESFRDIKEQIEKNRQDVDIDDIRRGNTSGSGSKLERLKKMLSFNGWLLPAEEEPIALSVLDSPFQAYRRQTVVHYELGTGLCHISERDQGQITWMIKLYLKTSWLILTKYHRTANAWRKAERKLGTARAWRNYLGIVNE